MSTFEVVRGAEGDCLLLDDTRICGPKPWGGGAVTKTFHTDKAYAVVPKDEFDRLKAENAKLREDLEFERSENGWAREFLNRMGQKCGTKDCPSLVAYVTKLESENAKLRELGMEVR
jgi:hypothetical protein